MSVNFKFRSLKFTDYWSLRMTLVTFWIRLDSKGTSGCCSPTWLRQSTMPSCFVILFRVIHFPEWGWLDRECFFPAICTNLTRPVPFLRVWDVWVSVGNGPTIWTRARSSHAAINTSTRIDDQFMNSTLSRHHGHREGDWELPMRFPAVVLFKLYPDYSG